MRYFARKLLNVLFLVSLLLAGCQVAPRETEPAFETLAPVDSAESGVVLPEAGGVFPAVTPTPGVYVRRVLDSYPAQESTTTSEATAYPGPAETATPQSTSYPAPVVTNTPAPTRSATPGGAATATGTLQPTLTATSIGAATATPQIAPSEAVSITATANEFVGQPIGTPLPSGSTVSIWHGLTGDQAGALERVIDSFQNAYPDVTFDVTYIPKDELRGRYEAASYYGKGPNLLLGPTAWGWWYAQSDLVMDLSAYASEEFLATINPAAVDTLYLGDKLIGLPYAQQGYVLYRNASILPRPAGSFDELIVDAQHATGLGIVGGYLERESLVSSATLLGMGGKLMDSQGRPAFNDDSALDWFNLLSRYAETGVAGMHTNRDLELFLDGKIGVIIEGTWRLDNLVEVLGGENLAVDPWPTAGAGRLSGFVQTEAVFLNTNTSPDNMVTSLRFMGYLLNRDVQSLLGETGLIPTVLDATPRGIHVQQAMTALQGGTAWPLVDEAVLQIYWNALDEAINNVFERGMSVTGALQSAYAVVNTRLDDLSK